MRGDAGLPEAKSGDREATLFSANWRPSCESTVSSTPTQVRERKLGDLFEYEIEHPVTIRRNQSALVPIVLRPFEGRPVLLYQKHARAENPMRCVEFENTTGLTLEGGPVTVLEGGSYVGEALLDTLKPDEPRLIPYAVELSVSVLDNVDSFDEKVLRVVIRKGTFQTHYAQVELMTYHFHNKSDAEQVVYLDHPRPGKARWKIILIHRNRMKPPKAIGVSASPSRRRR